MAENILHEKDAARFWSKVRKGEPDECWEWQGAENGRGYGTIHYGGAKTYTHRLAWILTNGDVRSGLCVCHRCDNPSCCNPAHLWLGTQTDNARDMASKGRNFRAVGELCGRAKLTNDRVLAIRSLADAGWSSRRIARVFGIGKSTAWSVASGNTWGHMGHDANNQAPSESQMSGLSCNRFHHETILKSA